MTRRPCQIIKEKCQSVVESYKFTRTKNCNWASSLTKLAHATAQEYEDRFLIELIQNGYDVHDAARSDGQIWIHFAKDEGEFGTLYVANGGRPFKESNFHAICEIAQSDKAPGSGIGNKGVGFKSVLHVCDSPEIFSVDGHPSRIFSFDGFCFRFAREDDYGDLCDGDVSLLDSMRRDVSPYFLPIHIPLAAESLTRFLRRGLVSAIRLPLSRKAARDVTVTQLEDLRSSPVPVLLFLPRIGRLVIEESEYGRVVARTTIRRTQTSLATPPSHACRWSTVTIARRDVGMAGQRQRSIRKFFLATKVVEAARLQTAITASIEDGYLDERFSEWTDEAEVSVAVELGVDTSTDCRLYTFLPMGTEAKSPFGGHLNAPFSPNLARTHVNAAVPLNNLFFDVAAELTAETVLALSEADSGVPGTVLLDLATWTSPFLPRLIAAFSGRDRSLVDYPMLPLVPAGELPSRGSIAESFAWTEEYRVFTVESLRQITRQPFLTAIQGPNRQSRLELLVASLGTSLLPADETLADWAVLVAENLVSATFDAVRWNDFYADLARMFLKRGEALAGRRLLLDSSNTLRQAGPFRATGTTKERPAVFFPPTTERSEDDEDVGTTAGVAIPDNLSPYMCYLHEELNWYERDGAVQRRTPAREFLQKAQLVQRFDTRSLIEHCSRISQATKSETIRESALRLAFNLQRAARSRDALGLERLPFRVPTQDGWRLATDAVFSQEWPGTRGSQIASLIANARAVSEDIALLEKRLLLSPKDEPFAGVAAYEWCDFLNRIGVKDGLWPVEMPISPKSFRGDQLTKERVGVALKMPDADVAQWKLTHTSLHNPSHPYTDYRVESPFFRLPGQFEFSQLTADAKHIYARLIAAQIGSWSNEHFSATIERPRTSGKDTLSWPSPLAAFVRHASWLPVREDAGTEKYVTPMQAWHFDESDGGSPPAFLPIVPRDVRRHLDASRASLDCLLELGRLRVVGRQQDSPALVRVLGDRLAASKVTEADAGAFRRLYNQAWSDMLALEPAQRGAFTKARNLHLAITQGSEVVPLEVRHDDMSCCDEVLFVVDSEDRLRRQLLCDLRFPTLDVGWRVGAKVVEQLGALFGDKIRGSTSVSIEVLADNVPVLPGPTLPCLLDEELEWVKFLVAVTVQLKGRVPSHHSVSARSQVQRRLAALRVVRGNRITLRVDQCDAKLPAFFHDVVLINDAEFPTVAIAAESTPVTWETLERLVPAIASATDRNSVQADLELAVHRLTRSAVDDRAQEPTEDEIADALAASVEEVLAFRREMRSQELAIFEYLYPVIWYLLGPETAALFEPGGATALTSKDDIRNALRPHEGVLPVNADSLLEKCTNSSSVFSIRDELGLDYAEFNATLRAIGPPYKAARNEEGHRNEFAFFKQNQGEDILGRVRARFLEDFRACRSLEQYVEVRDLKTLQPDPLWLDRCHLPTDTMMKGQADAWLRVLGAVALDEVPLEMLPLQTVRTDNRKAIRRISDDLWKVLPVWCSKNGSTPPPLWSQLNPGEVIADAMLDAGATDFERLSRERVFRWLAENGFLPTGMPQSTDLDSLGLTTADLTRRESEAERQKKEREYERRTIEIDGARYGSAPSECEALIEKIRASVSPEFLKNPTGLSRLNPTSGNRRPKRRTSGGGDGRGSEGRMTDAQKHALGFTGELLAFEWLTANYQGVTEACWKSKYRNLVCGGDTGDDSLGYDFEVFLRNKSSYLFEVKATTGSDCVIELGATELETSQQYARTNRYRILFIPNVLAAGRRRIFVLPNPFSKRGRGLFETTGTGIKFRFAME